MHLYKLNSFTPFFASIARICYNRDMEECYCGGGWGKKLNAFHRSDCVNSKIQLCIECGEPVDLDEPVLNCHGHCRLEL